MELEIKELTQEEVLVILDGTLDTVTSMENDESLTLLSLNYKRVIFDCAKLDYITSAGLRLFAKCLMNLKGKGGEMVLRSVNDEIMGVFKMVAYDKLFTFE